MIDVDGAQRAVVDHPPGPLRVGGGFGTGKTAALETRAGRLRREGRRPLLLRPTPVAFAAAVVARHGREVRTLSPEEQVDVVRNLLASEGRDQWPTLHGSLGASGFAAEVASTVRLYEGSFLGAEELLVHAEAAGELDRWDELHRFTERYLRVLDDRRVADERDARWLDEERRRFAIATTRARRRTVLVAEPPVTRFVRDLVV